MSKILKLEVSLPLPEDEFDAAAVTLASRNVHNAIKTALDEFLPNATLTKTISPVRAPVVRRKRGTAAAASTPAAEPIAEPVAEEQPGEEPTPVLEEVGAESPHESRRSRR